MSWDSWCDRILRVISADGKQTLCAHFAGIFGFDGSPWSVRAANEGSPNPLQSIGAAFFSQIKSTLESGPGGSIPIGDTSYMILRSDPMDKFVIGRKQGKGFTVAQGKQCYVVSLYISEEVSPGANTTQTCSVKDSLVESGY